MEQAREGHLADLTYVKLLEDGRRATFPHLPYVGEGWYAKPAAAYMLEKGIATWSDFAWSLDATAHVDQESVTQALQQMEAAWPEGEEHYAKLSVNALIGLWARNMDLIYTMRTSNHQFDGSGCQHRELFLDAAGGMHWDHIYVTQLLSNRSCRPVHDFVMASEYVAVCRIRDALAAVPSRYLKAVKTDCVVLQDLPKKFQRLVDGLVRERHPDGTPVYRSIRVGFDVEAPAQALLEACRTRSRMLALSSIREPDGITLELSESVRDQISDGVVRLVAEATAARAAASTSPHQGVEAAPAAAAQAKQVQPGPPAGVSAVNEQPAEASVSDEAPLSESVAKREDEVPATRRPLLSDNCLTCFACNVSVPNQELMGQHMMSEEHCRRVAVFFGLRAP